METFEIHITGDESIMQRGLQLGLKTIAVELLRPDRTVLRTEYMTSHVQKFENYEACKAEVDKWVGQLKDMGTDIIRVKIESPYYAHYVLESLYMESHFKTEDNKYPLSRNVKKDYCLGTARVYNNDYYSEFMTKWDEIELCLYDSDYLEDADWLDLWENTPEQVVILQKIIALIESDEPLDRQLWQKLNRELHDTLTEPLYGCEFVYGRWSIMLHGSQILHRKR